MKKIQFDNRKNVIAEPMKRCRNQAGLSQAQLAARLQTMGVSLDQQMISKIEHGTRLVTDYELACIAKALKISPMDLLQDFFTAYGD